MKTIRRIVTKTLNNTLHKYFDSDDDEEEQKTENIARALGPQSQPTQDYSDHQRADDEDLLTTTAAASDESEVSED